MPIVGLSDRDVSFPVIGQFRKGSPKRKNAQGKEIFGLELPYFRAEWAEGEEDYAARFEKIYGKTPNTIRVLFPFNEIERFWNPWKVAFISGAKLGQSDGRFINYLQDNKGNVLVRDGLDVKTGLPRPHPADNIAGYDYQNKPVEFKNSSILKVLVFDLPRAAYVEVITNSTNDIANISSRLRGFKELNGGQIAGIPFVIRRVAKMVSTPGDNGGPRVRRKKYLIDVEAAPEWMANKFGELRTLAAPTHYQIGETIIGALPAGDTSPVEWDEEDLEVEDAGGAPANEPAELPAREMVDPMGSKAVEYAAKKWNCTTNQAAQQIAKKNLGKLIAWDDLVSIVDPSPEGTP